MSTRKRWKTLQRNCGLSAAWKKNIYIFFSDVLEHATLRLHELIYPVQNMFQDPFNEAGGLFY